jgi:WD40 repeat protein
VLPTSPSSPSALPSNTPLVFYTPTRSQTPARTTQATPTQPKPVIAGKGTATALATPIGFVWPSPQPATIRAVPTTSLTPLAPGARLESLSEIRQLGKGTLRYFTFSPDGKWLGLATARGIALYDTRTLTETRFIPTPIETPRLAFSPDSRQLAAADRDSRVTLYEVNSGQIIRQLDNGSLGPPLTLSYFAGGSLLHVGTSSEVSPIWETETGKMLHRWYTTGNAAMAASADGVLLATSTWDGGIYLWTLEDGRGSGRLWSDSETLSMQYAPDGQTLLAGYGDNTAAIWKMDGGKLLRVLRGHSERVVTVAVSPDSKLAATGSWDNTICLWDMASGALLHTLKGHTGRIVQIGFSADGRSLASYADDGRLQFWSIPDGVQTWTLTDFAPTGNPVFAPDGETLYTGGQDGWLRWWSANGGLLRERLAHLVGISALAVAPDGKWIVSGGNDGQLRLWEAGNGQLVAELDPLEAWANCLVFSPDGHWLAASTANGTLRLWDMTTLKPVVSIQTGEEAVLRLAFSPDSRTLAAGSLNGSVALWRIGDTAQPLRVVREKGLFVSGLAFSPDGQILAAGGDEKKISLWRLNGGTLTFTIESKRSEGLAALAFTPDGQMLAASFWDRTLRFYNPSNGSLLRSFDLPFAARQISLAPDGRRLALGLDDGTVRVWGIK